ncbi:MAG: T9SS type A sorting domain-containing protein [Chitinophagaceae bacterium]|nr:T9SS type A sorting domain-containing protein [Chitinophagaceae bacterium]
MKKTPYLLRLAICLCMLAVSSSVSFASHIVGSDLTYSWVSGNTYTVRLTLYADCGPASAAAYAGLPTAVPQICVYDDTTLVTTFNLSITGPSAGIEVTPTLCPGVLSQCDSVGSTMPGITLFEYTGTYTLPSASANWEFRYVGNLGSSGAAGRAGAITNLITAGSSTMALSAKLNNSSGHNTSPVLNVIPLPYYAINMFHNYNPVAIDAEGDSLVYSLIDVTGGSGSAACTYAAPPTYGGGLSGSAPLLTAPGTFSFNTFSGQLSFYPNVLQRAAALYNIKEYRGGTLIGSLQRELTILINATTNHLPGGNFTSVSGCTLVDTTTILVCDTTGSFSATIPAFDADAADSITLVPFGVPAGATLSITGNGTPSPVSTFSWNGTTAPHGLHTFFIKYFDNACPMNGYQTIAYKVQVTDCSYVPTNTKGMANSKAEGVFPNPASDALTIAHGDFNSACTITLYDAVGRAVKTTESIPGTTQTILNTSDLPNGLYTVRLINESGTRNITVSVQH